MCVLLVGCGSGAAAGQGGREGSGNTAETIAIRLRADPFAGGNPFLPLAAPAGAQPLVRLVFAGAATLGSDLAPRPDLAEDWTISPNGLVWTVRLRPDLRWHDGVPLTAEDLAFTYRLLQAGAVNTAAAADFQQVVEDVTTTGDRTLRIALRRPFAPLATDLATPVLPRHILHGAAKPAETPVMIGSGPFRLADYQAGREIALEAVPSPLLDPRRFARAILRVQPDEGVALADLMGGQIDLAEIAPATAEPLPATFRRGVVPELGYDYVAFNLRPGRLFADKTLRSVWELAIDKAAVARGIDGALPVWSHLPPSSWAHDPGLPKPAPDPEAARRLLDEAGWSAGGDGVRQKAGRALAFDLYVRADAPERVAAAGRIAEGLATVGVQARVRPADFGTTLAAIRRPPFDFDAALMGWDLGPDPDDYYLFGSGQIPTEARPSLLNYAGFASAEFDRLSVEARTATTLSRRRELYGQTQRLIAEERPYYPLWARTFVLAASPGLRGPVSLESPYYLWNLGYWYVAR